jgi:hypothetical protein
VLEGHRGVKPLTDSDCAEIRSNIDEKILRGQPIKFSSSAVELSDGRLVVRGELAMAGTTKLASFELRLDERGRVAGALPVPQSEWGIKPYRAFIGRAQSARHRRRRPRRRAAERVSQAQAAVGRRGRISRRQTRSAVRRAPAESDVVGLQAAVPARSRNGET